MYSYFLIDVFVANPKYKNEKLIIKFNISRNGLIRFGEKLRDINEDNYLDLFKENIDYLIDAEDSTNTKKLIIKEFRENNDEIQYEIEQSNLKKLTLSLIGVLFIIASYFFNHIMGDILEEILMIFGWVALWEVAYAIFFTDASRRRKIKRNNQIIHADIKYKDK